MVTIMRKIRNWIAERLATRRTRRTILESDWLRSDVGLKPNDRTERWYDAGR